MYMKRRRKCSKLLRVNGRLVESVSVAGLSRVIGRSRDTILRYEANGVFPPAPLLVKGVRYYPYSLAERLAVIVRKFPVNRKISADLTVRVNILFNEEKEKLKCQNPAQKEE